MSYKILPYTKSKAKKLGVVVKPSTSKGKKIDVYKGDEKIASVGAIGYKDYPTYKELEKKGKVKVGTAKKRQVLYKIRHKKDKNVKNSNGYYADKLLW
jgi:hypothetical protein